MKVVKLLGGLIAVLIVSIVVGVYLYLHSTLPEYEGNLAAGGITGEVEIIRDSFGMPHIYAASDEDAAFALGYCMAQDRLFQMELVRRSVTGRLSEILGKRFIDVDRLFRTITAQKSLDQVFAEQSPEVTAIMEAYAAGINDYLSRHEGNLPFEFALLGFKPEPWKASDEMAALYYMAWALNFSFHSELLYSAVIDKVGPELAGEIFVAYPAGAPTILSDRPLSSVPIRLLETIEQARVITGAVFTGASNNWVVSGGKSETGLPLLANDMHLGLIIPGIWYEAHLVTPQVNVSGVVLPCVPVVVAGANEHIAWGFTNVMADDADFYEEKINPDDSNQYAFMDAWEEMTIRHDSIAVRDSDAVPITIRITRHGPIIDDVIKSDSLVFSRHPIAMRWTITDAGDEALALYRVNRATSIDDVEKAAALHKCPGQNWVYADDQGNIGFWAAVGIPIRDGFVGDRILPGWDGRHEWSGYVPTEQQPHAKNPPEGWIATANNKHVGGEYPYVISNCYAPPDRFVRISQLLNEKAKLGVADFARMQADVYLVMAEVWTPKILSALDGAPWDEHRKEALDSLRQWDYNADADRVAPAVYHVIIQRVLDNTFKDRLGDSLYHHWLGNVDIVYNSLQNLITNKQSQWFDKAATPAVETFNSVIVTSFDEAIEYLDSTLGDDVGDWTWGKLHSLTLSHPVGAKIPVLGGFMNVGPFPMGGSSNSVNAGLYRLTNPWRMLAGSSQRHIFDLGNMKNSLRITPTGISGNFVSDHYDDQTDLWRTGRYRPFHLDREDVEKDARYRMKLVPAEKAATERKQ